MSGKVLVMFALLAALVVSGADSAPAESQESSTLHQLLADKEKTRDWSRRQDLAPQTQSARMLRRAHLSEDEREIMTKQIMQAISEMINTECLPDRDYQGWVDFGRRDTE
nr:cholecystokinin [Solea senegalensis]